VQEPVLYLIGEFDATRPSTVRKYQELTPNAEFHLIKSAGHQTVHDNPKEAIETIDDFLDKLERK